VTAPGASDQYHLFTARLETSTLVVGRSTQFITATLKQLLYDFAFAGVLGALASLLIGYLVSKRMFVKLARLAGILDSVSRGDMQVRLPVDKSDDQIDRVSQQINAHLDQLAMLMSATRNTVNSIAHDLRAPLNRTYLLLQDALEAQDADSQTGKLIDDAGKELNKVNEIIDTILRIARIQGGSDQPYFSVFSLNEQVSDLADIFQPIIESADQVLIREIPSTPDVQVYGDKKMVRQMLVNLIENAICHCPAGTQITLVTGGTPQRGGFVQVADTGPGIDEGLREKVLEPFFRVDASRTSPGSGLGLTLVKAIVMRHAAELSLEDNEPGLRVTVTFPPIQPGMDTGS
jgi:signal transduction histidine kinase